MYFITVNLVIFVAALHIKSISTQNCPKEVSKKGISVTWHESQSAINVVSDPACYQKGKLITRECNFSTWIPPLEELEPCFRIVDYMDLSSCPPGFHTVSEQNNKYCYQIGEPTSWNYPCLKNGGASVITDLNNEEIDSLIESLKETNSTTYFWLPAQRRKRFNPVVWSIPGPNWGEVVHHEKLMPYASMFKNCLMLDIETRLLTTETCTKTLPSLCIYINDLNYPTRCPDGYYAFRFMSDNGTCFGIEQSENFTGKTFDSFLNSKCRKPMGDIDSGHLTRYFFMQLAELKQLPDNAWCWFATSPHAKPNKINENVNSSSVHLPLFHNIVNNIGMLSLLNESSNLPCMACEAEFIHDEETMLELEYNYEEMKLFLTIYFPSGLWKYNDKDNGVQCFSDAKGFVTPIKVQDIPLMKTNALRYSVDINSSNVEKIIFTIDPVTNRSAQYWCEGHNQTLSLLSTNKIIANPTGNILHVFAMVLQIPLFNESALDTPSVFTNLSNVFRAQKILLMDIFEYTPDNMLVLVHLHVAISNEYDDETSNLKATYELLYNNAVAELPLINITFVNISSCVYCLPTTSMDYMVLDWELTSIGHVAAPKQFCLQSNGLPVKRNCLGSYLLGGIWGKVEGQCNETYEPSKKTTFLYNFAKAQYPNNYTSRFMTDGLGFVLDNVDVIIPADIYYLAISLQHVITVAEVNQTSVDMGDVENLVWAMDKILILDYDYLRLAQTFNSTNIILDSVNEILEKLAQQTLAVNSTEKCDSFQLSVKPQFIAQISYPAFNNITGVALVKNTESENFTDMIIQPLYRHSTLRAVLSIRNLELAVWVPETVLNNLQRTFNESKEETIQRKEIHVVITIHNNDAVFQQLDTKRRIVKGRVVGVTIPGFVSNLKHPIPILYKDTIDNKFNIKCGYWDFQARTPNSNPGYWSDRGCFYKKSINNVTICQCYHMTNFGQLLDIGSINRPGNFTVQNKCHSKALNIITLVGSFLSLFGIFGILLTALVFRTWRHKPGTKVLLQLSTAIALPLILMIVFNLDNTFFSNIDGKYVIMEHKKILCVVLGSLLQYSILASFTWMLITAVLQFIRYVRVFQVCRPSGLIIKFTLVGWGVPLIPVVITLAVNYENYIPEPTVDDQNRICYPHGIYFLLGILMPICIVLLVNVTLFILVLNSIYRSPKGKLRTTDMDLVGTQLRLSIFLFFLLGFTWLFGILSLNGSLLWSYLFCLTSSLQGFVLFVYFVVCDPATRNLWINLMKPHLVSASRKSISSISSS